MFFAFSCGKKTFEFNQGDFSTMDILKKSLIAATIGFVAIGVFGTLNRTTPTAGPPAAATVARTSAPTVTPPAPAAVDATDALLAQAFQQRLSNYQITGSLPVSRLLPDDNNGSRHQKFILQTSTGQTVLIAHNIDLAPRIANLQVGDTVEFYGEYEWNEKGGVIHWTHHDPAGRHAHGWLRHKGSLYQ